MKPIIALLVLCVVFPSFWLGAQTPSAGNHQSAENAAVKYLRADASLGNHTRCLLMPYQTCRNQWNRHWMLRTRNWSRLRMRPLLNSTTELRATDATG